MSAVLDVHRLQLSTTPTDRLETLVGNTGACLDGQRLQLRATLSEGDEALVRDQRAASDVQTLQRVALGGDLSEPNIGHLRNTPRVQRRLIPLLLPLGRCGRHGLVGR